MTFQWLVLVNKIPSDKFTFLNLAFTCHAEKTYSILSNRKPLSKFKVINDEINNKSSHIKIYEYYKIYNGDDFYAPLSEIYEYHTTMSTIVKSSAIVDKIPPNRTVSSYSQFLYLKRRVSSDKIFLIVVDAKSYKPLFLMNVIHLAYPITRYGEKSRDKIPVDDSIVRLTFVKKKGHNL